MEILMTKVGKVTKWKGLHSRYYTNIYKKIRIF